MQKVTGYVYTSEEITET